MFYYISSIAVTLAVLASMIGLRHLKKVMRIGLADSDIAAQKQYGFLDEVGRSAGAGLIGKSSTERIPTTNSAVNNLSTLPTSFESTSMPKGKLRSVRKA